ncbi:MAG: alpha/beta hydrolase [Deltaproteobacteria bacterium]|nr:alpha/beta hydrolase [Deltaproteobacteria bacterium]
MPYFKKGYDKLYYKILNPKAKKSLLCLHGWGTNHAIWSGAEKYLKSYRIIKVDLPGMGKSSYNARKVAPSYLNYTTNLICNLLDELSIKDFSILGHSIGGILAVSISNKLNPKAILLDSTPLLGGKGVTTKVKLFATPWMIRTPLYAALRIPWATRRIVHNTLENIDLIPLKKVNSLIKGFNLANQYALFDSLIDSLKKSIDSSIKNFTGSFFYIVGENNQTLNGDLMIKFLQDIVKKTKIKKLAKTRHYPQLENPDEYYKTVDSFLAAV